MNPSYALASCFAVSAGSGLAALLWSNKKLSIRAVLATVLYSGMMGLIIGLLWFRDYGEKDPYFMLGCSGLCGLGRVTVVDLVAIAVKKSGISFKIVKNNEE